MLQARSSFPIIRHPPSTRKNNSAHSLGNLSPSSSFSHSEELSPPVGLLSRVSAAVASAFPSLLFFSSRTRRL